MLTNRQFSETSDFKANCKKVGIKPTKRQVSKYNMRKGFLYLTIQRRQKNIHLPKEARFEF